MDANKPLTFSLIGFFFFFRERDVWPDPGGSRRAASPQVAPVQRYHKGSGQSAGFSPMPAAQLSGVNDLMTIKLYPQPGRPSLTSWLQVSEAKLSLRATEPLGRLKC